MKVKIKFDQSVPESVYGSVSFGFSCDRGSDVAEILIYLVGSTFYRKSDVVVAMLESLIDTDIEWPSKLVESLEGAVAKIKEISKEQDEETVE